MKTVTIRVEFQIPDDADSDVLDSTCMSIYNLLKQQPMREGFAFGNITADVPQERERFGWTLASRDFSGVPFDYLSRSPEQAAAEEAERWDGQS